MSPRAIFVSLIGAHRLRAFRAWVYRLILCKSRKIISDYQWRIFRLRNKHLWVGYYDLNVFDPHSRLLLCTSADLEFSKYSLVTVNIDSGVITPLVDNVSGSKQMGCRAMWLDSSSVLFNNLSPDGVARMCRLDVNTGECLELGRAFYDATPTVSVSLSFEHLEAKRPGYGFKGQVWPGSHSKIYIQPLEVSGQYLNTVDEITCSVCNDENYLNHLKLSPNGNRLLYFVLDSETEPHSASAWVMDLGSGDQWPLTHERARVSHYAWLSDDELCLTYFQSGAAYYGFFRMIDNDWVEGRFVADGDGHPTFIDESSMITDTYPDKAGYQHLRFFYKEKGFEPVASFRAKHHKLVEDRCDLHPCLLGSEGFAVDTDLGGKSRSVVVIFT